MRKIFALIIVCTTLKGFSQNVGIGTSEPTHPLHVISATNPVRIEGLLPGSINDSVITVDDSGVLRKRSGSITLSLTGWSTTGNAGTLPASNFIGTTDNKALVLRTNNQSSGFIEPSPLLRNNSYGNRSLGLTVTGTGNNALGYQALSGLTSGSGNTAAGDSAAFTLTTGNDNVAIGSRTLVYAGTAINNVAVGSNALKNNLASENIAVGKDAALGNISGANIIAVGTGALQNSKATGSQIVIGNYALQNAISGQDNVVAGYNSGLFSTSSSYNILLGNYTLSSTTGSARNTIIGHNAASAYTATGNGDNVFVGYQSALSQTGGNGDTYVGSGIDVAGNFSPNNSSALGQNVVITANNQVRIGNSNVTSIGGQVGWTTFSDARIKKNVQTDVPGLSFIEKLRPVTYNYDLDAMQQLQGAKNAATDKSIERIRFTGLLAQEVEAAAQSTGYSFSGIDKPENEHSLYGLRYAELVVPLIKSVQEMKALIDQQQKEIEDLKKKIKE